MRNIIMKNPPTPLTKSTQQGIVLLEALVAVLLFSMGVLALVGLQAAMMKNTEDSKFRSEASFIAQQRLGIMWANPSTIASYIEQASAPANISTLPNGTRTTSISTVSGVSEVTVTVNWQQPGKDPHHFTTVAHITESGS